MCNSVINKIYDKGKKGSSWIYEELRNKYKILFYSGDADGGIPTLGSLKWIKVLNW